VVGVFFAGRMSMLSTVERYRRENRDASKREHEAKLRAKNLQASIDSGTAVPIRRVVGVLDDNTIFLRRHFTNEKSRVRLYGVIPEPALATRFITNSCFQKDVRITEMGQDTSGQFMVDVLIEGRSLSAELLRGGLARLDKDVATDNEEFARLEAEARRLGRGLWEWRP
jgi:endonuclease YncB( thermonuclease family)